jgi:hypothetical protein
VIIRKKIIDSIVMAIYRTLVEKGNEKLRLERVEKLVWPGSLMEDPARAERRPTCQAFIKSLEQPANVLTDIQKIHI